MYGLIYTKWTLFFEMLGDELLISYTTDILLVVENTP